MNHPAQPKILVACIGNMFLGDDGFGCEVARALAAVPLPPEILVMDFGICGFDLAIALLEPYQTVILVDAIARNMSPGAVSVFQPVDDGEVSDAPQEFDPHSITPDSVLKLARTLGEITAELYIVGCEPLDFGDKLEGRMALSEVVQAAVPRAVRVLTELIADITRQPLELNSAA